MKIRTLSILAVTIALGAAVSAFTFHNTTWTVNAKDAKINFTMPNGKHSGTVGGLNASFTFEPAHPELAVIKATVDVKELKSDNDKLTEHLMSVDFFDAANHPQITFTADKVTKNDSGFVATGKLAMRDSVKTVSIPFTFKQADKKAMVIGSLDIFAGDYGVGKKSEKGSDRVLVSIEMPVSQE